MPLDIGEVEAITIRSANGWQACERARLTGMTGFDDDMHAHPLSPRQVLIASTNAYADLALPPHALRENLLVDADTARLQSGTVLQIGSAVRLRLMFQCEACGQLDSQQPGLSRKIGMRRGMMARVLEGGVIVRGDRIRDLGVLELPWFDDWRARVAQVLAAVPDDAVIEYRHLARLAGIQSSYCRAFPKLLRALGERAASKAVSSQSASPLPRWEGAGLFERR